MTIDHTESMHTGLIERAPRRPLESLATAWQQYSYIFSRRNVRSLVGFSEKMVFAALQASNCNYILGSQRARAAVSLRDMNRRYQPGMVALTNPRILGQKQLDPVVDIKVSSRSRTRPVTFQWRDFCS